MLALYSSVSAQVVTNVISIETTQYFGAVRDSIAKLTNPTNTIHIKICEGVREYFLTRDSLHWRGYYIKNLISGSERIDYPISDNHEDSVKNKPNTTSLVSFNADSLYMILIDKKKSSNTNYGGLP